MSDHETPSNVRATTGSELLARVRAGEITREQYVEARVREATAHLKGVPPSEIEALQQDLRDRCASDPLLQELIDRATH
jgi:hypothetical protein